MGGKVLENVNGIKHHGGLLSMRARLINHMIQKAAKAIFSQAVSCALVGFRTLICGLVCLWRALS